jgi:DNA primase
LPVVTALLPWEALFLSNFIPEEKIEEIKNAADIVEVVSDYVLLKKTGKNYSGLCPFHAEKDASFTVSPAKQIFHCFGCNTGGNVFNFLIRHDGVSFPEAVRLIARRYSIDLPERKMSQAMREQISEREKLLSINRMAMDYYHWNLLHDSYGKQAMAYLQKRGMDPSIIDKFQLGYARNTWDGLRNYLQSKRVPVNLIEKSGLVIPKKSGTGHYDRFRERIVFPIYNLNKQVVGFGGRVLDDSLPKYLNSPETPVYSKSKLLYGMHLARNKCRETRTVYIVEGYFDLLALHQYGVENAGATLGTALTTEHIHMIKGFAEKVILVFDADDAGIKASLRSVGIFIEKGMQARVMLLPKGHDPDSFMRKYGIDAFKETAAKSRSVITFIMESAQNKYGLSVDGKMRIIEELKMPLASIQDIGTRNSYIKEVWERLGVKEYDIRDKVDEAVAEIQKTEQVHRNRPAGHFQQELSSQQPLKEKTKKQVKGTRLELQILAMMLQYPAILPEIIQGKVLDYFTTESLKSLGDLILSMKNEKDRGVSNLISIVDDDEKRNILASLSIKEEMWNQKDCRKVITKFVQNSPLRYSISLTEQIKAAEKDNNQDLLFKLLQEKQNIAVSDERQKQELFK